MDLSVRKQTACPLLRLSSPRSSWGSVHKKWSGMLRLPCLDLLDHPLGEGGDLDDLEGSLGCRDPEVGDDRPGQPLGWKWAVLLVALSEGPKQEFLKGLGAEAELLFREWGCCVSGDSILLWLLPGRGRAENIGSVTLQSDVL